MKILTKAEQKNIHNWFNRNARAIELMRYKFTFEAGDQQAVLAMLKDYQNEDGGFGHALEPDAWNPNSSPIQTWCATSIINELSGIDKEDPIILGILKYLDETTDYQQNRFASTIPSNDAFSHAPWWTHSKEAYEGFNPTAALAGFILKYEETGTKLFEKALIVATEAIDHVITKGTDKMHELDCFITLKTAIESAGLDHLFRFKTFKEKLMELVDKTIETDVSNWTDYVCKPSFFIENKNSPYLKGHEGILNKELDEIVTSLNAEDVWDINWNWSDDLEAFAVSKRWWQGQLIIKNMQLLKAFGRLE